MTPTEVRQLLAELGLRPSKVLGQNFLTDQNIRDIVIREADIRPDETVLEIGPGLGALTGELIKRARRLVVIEKDKRLCAFLRSRYPGLELVEGDATQTELLAGNFKVVSNLPYSISTPILERLVEGESKPRLMVFMVQREVAQRLAATPRHKDYGALTLFTQLHYHVTISHIVSARCFFPAPMVESAIIVLDRRDPRVKLRPGAPFHEIVRQGFGQRRKMLRKLLAERPGLERAFAATGIAPTARAEELSLEDWIRLANELS
jgi:16S rRNA (adenine1518-N6/adenine1519-N6)-dimethyltransferase